MGVTVFLPDAEDTLLELSLSVLKCCTKGGLRKMYEKKYGVERSADEKALSLEEFAWKTSSNICLYDHMSHALGTSSP